MYIARHQIVFTIFMVILTDLVALQLFDKTRSLPPEVSAQLDDYWSTYKATFNKSYDAKVEKARRIAWEKNLVKIYEHNLMAAAGHHSYILRDNHIADLNTRQYIREMIKLVPSRKRRVAGDDIVGSTLGDGEKIPTHFDWRELGFVTAADNQKGCGSCYAYSIAGVIEGQIFKQTGRVIPLSEQQLIDCSRMTGNFGCQGGSLRNALRYLEKSKGLMPRSSYPYEGQQGRCRFRGHMSIVNITSWAILPARDEKALETAIATIGPIAASINANPKTFQLYHKGVYNDPGCSSNTVNHAVLVVGYTPHEWIIKNWWGETWGENGYMRLARHKNLCGIANYAAYARV